MHGFRLQNSCRKYHATQRGSNTSFSNHYVCITFGTSYRIRRGNVFVEHRGNDHFHFCEQCKHLYCYSDRSERMHGIGIVNCFRKHDTTQRGSNTSFCNHNVRITFGTSYRIRRRNLFMEHRSNYYFHFSEQRKYLYRNSDRS